jgi:hypothetical protein
MAAFLSLLIVKLAVIERFASKWNRRRFADFPFAPPAEIPIFQL